MPGDRSCHPAITVLTRRQTDADSPDFTLVTADRSGVSAIYKGLAIARITSPASTGGLEALGERGDGVVGVDSFSPYYSVERKRANLDALINDGTFTFVEGDLNELDLEALLDGVDVVYHLAGQPGALRNYS
jgi:hypothetical protein